MQKHRFISFFTLICILICTTSVTPIHAEQTIMDVHFINVGQGDSILIETPDDKHILIDGGPPEAGKDVVAYLKKRDVSEIDLMIATHPDMDHIGGLKKVIQSMPVKQVMDIGKVYTTKTYMGYMYQLFKQKIPLQIAEEGRKLTDFKNLDIRILNAYNGGESNNEASLVLQLGFGKVNFLFMGDVGKQEEKRLLDKYDLKADIVKIGHHGSQTSTSLSFLKEVQPKVAFITYKKRNKYGHPVDDVIQNLHDVDAQIFSTGVYGNVIIQTDGQDYMITSEKFPMDGIKPAN